MNEEMTADAKHKGVITRVRELFGVSEVEEDFEEFEEVAEDTKKRPVTLRLHSAKVTHVAVRQPQSFEDARIAADGLKEGRQQIVNLERTPQDLAERIIDFLNGVTYALNGFVEKVGERVYLFAPSNTIIDVPEDLHKNAPGLFEPSLQ